MTHDGKDKPKAVLLTAFAWVCDSCGHYNFARAVAMESPSDEDIEEATREAFGLDDHEPIPEGMGGVFVLAPERVTCDRCGEVFETEDEDDG